MGWFDSQIKERIVNDEKKLQNSYQGLATVVDKSRKRDAASGQEEESTDALLEICKFYHVDFHKIPEGIEDVNEQMDYLFRPAGIMRRRVQLTGKWWKDCYGPVLGEKKNGGMVALLPKSSGGYQFFDHAVGTRLALNQDTAELLEKEAVCFYKPLPQRELTQKDLFHFLLASFSRTDVLMILLMSLLVTLTGMITPAATSLLFGAIIPSGQDMLLYAIAFMLAGVAVSGFLLNIVKTVFKNKIQQQMKLLLRSAFFARVINLPVNFFKKYSSGDMGNRVSAVDGLCEIFCESLLGMGVTALFSLTYIAQIFVIAPSLVFPALIALILQLAVGVIGIAAQTDVSRRQLQADTKLQGIVFALFSGIQKIKLAGCEKRAFAKWANSYQEKADAAYNPPLMLKVQMALAPAAAIFGMLLIYWAAASTVSVSQYVAFNSAYGMVSTAILSLIQTTSMLAMLRPVMELVKPILEEVPETREEKEIVRHLSGGIELNNVSFGYTEDGPLIIDNLNLKIRRGQYVAIVGTTGCGKSTLMRLMLGFETPDTGAVYYDGKDLQKVEQRSLRKNIGVVMQNGKLFSGDIFSNITISAPQLTLKEAWEAAETAGVADDIRDMPMGMNTILSEGSGGISGGQKQRIMIARAIAHKPRILMLDEATSALDNITQKQVSDSLNRMKCTRIVIAHRLSTIRECDRIIVLDKGAIIEDGTYEELNAKGGFFSELVARQQVNA